MFILKQSTAADIKLGPFVDKGDGVAYEIGMAAAMDHATTGVRLSKNGAAFADRHEGTEPVYDAFGYYLVKLDTTDTDTVGRLKVIFGDAAVCLPCEANFQVVEEAIYDSLYAASAVGFDANQRVNVGQWLSQAVTLSTGNKPDVNIDEISDDTTAPGNLELMYDGTGYAGGGVKLGVDLVSILGTALTETSGLIAAAFKKFFNVAAPTATCLSLPDAVPGAAGGVFIAGTNAATAVTTALTANITGNVTGNLSGTVGSVTGAVGSVTGAVGSVTGNVGGNVVGTVGKSAMSLAAGDVTGNLPADVIALSGDTTAADNAEAFFDGTGYAGTNNVIPAVTTVTNLTNAPTNGDLTATMKSSVTAAVPAVAAVADAVWDETIADHDGAGSTGLALAGASAPSAASVADAVWDEAVADHSGAGSTGLALAGASAPAASAVADAVWDEVLSGHLGAGSTGEALNAAGAAGDPWVTALPGAYGAGSAGKIIGDNLNAPIATVDTVVDGIATTLGAAGAGLTALGDSRLANLDATISSRTKPADTQAAVTLVATTTNLTNAPTAGDFTSTMKTSLNAATPASVVGAVGSVAAGVTVTTNNDKTGYGLSATAIQAIWEYATRSLTTFGTLASDIATAVWGAAARTLTAFGFTVTAGTVTDKTGYSLAVAPPTAAEVKTAIEADGSKLDAVYDKLPAGSIGDATAANQATIAGYLDTEVAAILAAVDTEVAAIKAQTDLIPASPAAVSDIPTAAQNADKLLGRNIAGGSDGTRTVTSALRALRNKTASVDGTLTVYQENDSTPDWTAALSTDAAAEPITVVDPT